MSGEIIDSSIVEVNFVGNTKGVDETYVHLNSQLANLKANASEVSAALAGTAANGLAPLTAHTERLSRVLDELRSKEGVFTSMESRVNALRLSVAAGSAGLSTDLAKALNQMADLERRAQQFVKTGSVGDMSQYSASAAAEQSEARNRLRLSQTDIELAAVQAEARRQERLDNLARSENLASRSAIVEKEASLTKRELDIQALREAEGIHGSGKSRQSAAELIAENEARRAADAALLREVASRPASVAPSADSAAVEREASAVKDRLSAATAKYNVLLNEESRKQYEATIALEAKTKLERTNAELKAKSALYTEEGTRVLIAENEQMRLAVILEEQRIKTQAVKNSQTAVNLEVERAAYKVEQERNAQRAYSILLSKGYTEAELAAAGMLKSATSATTSFDNATRSMLRGVSAAGGGLFLTYAKDVGVMVAAFAAAEAVIKSFTLGAEFEKNMHFVQGITGLSTSEYKAMSGNILGGQNQLFSPVEQSKGLKELAHAGYTASESWGILQSAQKMAYAGEMDLSAATLSLQTVLHAFNLTASDSEHVVSVLAKADSISATTMEQMSKAMERAAEVGVKYNVGLEEMAAMLATLGQRHLVGEKAGTALVNVFRELTVQTPKAEASMRALGVAVFDEGTGRMKSASDILLHLADSVKNLTDQSKTKLLGDIFDMRAMKGIVPLLQDIDRVYAQFLVNIQDASKEGETFIDRVLKPLQNGDVSTALSMLGHSIQSDLIEGFVQARPAILEAEAAMRQLFGGENGMATLVGYTTTAVSNLVMGVANLFTSIKSLVDFIKNNPPLEGAKDRIEAGFMSNFMPGSSSAVQAGVFKALWGTYTGIASGGVGRAQQSTPGQDLADRQRREVTWNASVLAGMGTDEKIDLINARQKAQEVLSSKNRLNDELKKIDEDMAAWERAQDDKNYASTMEYLYKERQAKTEQLANLSKLEKSALEDLSAQGNSLLERRQNLQAKLETQLETAGLKLRDAQSGHKNSGDRAYAEGLADINKQFDASKLSKLSAPERAQAEEARDNALFTLGLVRDQLNQADRAAESYREGEKALHAYNGEMERLGKLSATADARMAALKAGTKETAETELAKVEEFIKAHGMTGERADNLRGQARLDDEKLAAVKKLSDEYNRLADLKNRAERSDLSIKQQIEEMQATSELGKGAHSTAEKLFELARAKAKVTDATIAETEANAAIKKEVYDKEYLKVLSDVVRYQEAARKAEIDNKRAWAAATPMGTADRMRSEIDYGLREQFASLRAVKEQIESSRQAYASGGLSDDLFIQEMARYDSLKGKLEENISAMRRFKQEEIDRYEASRTASHGANEFLINYAETATNSAEQIKRVFSDAFQGASKELTSFITTGKMDFNSFAETVIADLVRMELEMKVLGPMAQGLSNSNLLQSALGFLGLGGGGSAASSFSMVDYAQSNAASSMYTSLSLNAKGNIFADTPGISDLRNGVYNSPTLFKFASGAGVLGEAGYEGVLPLTRTSGGKLGVEAVGSSSAPTEVKIVIENKGAAKNATAGSTRLDGSTMVLSVMMEDAANNGPYIRMLRGQ